MSATTSTSITWTWDAVDDVLGYQGQFSTDATFADNDQTFLIIAPMTSHTVSNLSGSTTGHFRVRSGTGSLTALTYSEWTAGTPGTTSAPPAAVALDAPDNLRSSDPENDSIVLTWDEVDDAEEYEVEQRAGDATSYSDASCDGEGNDVEDTTCTATGLDEGTDYDFRVRGIPADDDTANANGAWASTSGTTTGRARTAVTPGGMGDLNVRWHNGSDDESDIVFVWDRQGDAMYETYTLTLATTDLYEDDPCADVNNPGTAAPQYEAGTSATTLPVDTNTPGTIMGVCVRAEGTSEASFAWGISAPAEPDVGTAVVEKDVTTELEWGGIDLKGGFDYEIHLAADPERPATDNKIPGRDTEATNRAVQAACEAGTRVDSFTPDINLDDRTVSVDSGLKPHTGYLLCLRASNGAGTGTWAVPPAAAETYTRPAAPPRGGTPDIESVDATDTNNEQLGLTWEIGTRSVSNVPRESDDFNVFVFAQDDEMPDADALKVANCGSAAPTGYEVVTPTKADGLSGFEVSVAPGEMTERVDFTRRVYMCAQADSSNGGAGKGAGPWTLTGPYNIAKPSTSLSTDSASVTHDAATIEIKGWNSTWYYKRYKTSADFATETCVQPSATEVEFTGLDSSTRYSVKAYASQGACDDDKRSLGSTSFTTKAPPS